MLGWGGQALRGPLDEASAQSCALEKVVFLPLSTSLLAVLVCWGGYPMSLDPQPQEPQDIRGWRLRLPRNRSIGETTPLPTAV